MSNRLLLLAALLSYLAVSWYGVALANWRTQMVAIPESAEGGVLARWLGESRQIVGELSLRRADVTLHAGFYPSFWEGSFGPEFTQESAQSHADTAHREEIARRRPTMDWIEFLNRQRKPSHAVHLEHGNPLLAKEILPWIQLSSMVDPHNETAWMGGAFWLFQMRRIEEGLHFLERGIAASPDSPALEEFYARALWKHRHDAQASKRHYFSALRKWERAAAGGQPADILLKAGICSGLSAVYRAQGRPELAQKYTAEAVRLRYHPARHPK